MKRSPLRKSRSKPRPGRLKGDDMDALRLLAFVRDEGCCVTCGKMLDPLEFHLAHKRGKRMWGDSLDNVHCKCFDCHIVKEHNPKACPPKERRPPCR